MSGKIITLYIDDTSIRLLVTQGKRIKKWADMPLEPGLVKNAVVLNETEVAAKIKQLLKTQKVNTKKVILGVSGLHCLSRPISLPQLPRVMLEEAVKREAKRMLPVPIEQLYLSWQTISSSEGKVQVFLVAIPCKTADALLKMLYQAGLKPYLMDLKPLLLARMVKEATAIIVDIQPTEFDIVIMADGVPQPIRTVALPSESLSWQKKLPMIRDELDRTIKFYNSNNPEKTLASSTPIFVSGELTYELELCQSLAKELGYPVLPLALPLECPGGLDPARYMVNISLVLKKLSSGKESGPLVANLNTLPAAYRPQPISLTRVLALPGAVVASLLLVLLVILVQGAATDISSIRGRLDTTSQLLRQKLSQRQELTQKIAELNIKIAEAETSRDKFTTALSNLERQSRGVNGNLAVTISSLPPMISLSKINQADSILVINGSSPSEKEVLSYLRNLDASGKFSQITITSMRKIEGGGMDFTLTLISPKQPTDGVNSNLEITISSLPPMISLSKINQADSTLTINGRSPSEKEVLSYLRSLDASGKFSEITITSMRKIEGGGMDFTLVLKVGGQD